MGFIADYRNALLLDVETGSLSAKKSPLLSLSYGAEKVTTTHVDPTGFYVSDWAQKHVLDPAKGLPRIKEESAIRGFLRALEGREAQSTIAGWNIGYQASPTAGGFDLPFLAERARRYGLESRLGAAVSRLNVRDVGQEFLVSAALKIRSAERQLGEGFSEVVDPNLWKQMRPYAEQAAYFERKGLDVPQIARKMSGGFNPQGSRWMVAGWKQDVAFETLFGKAPEVSHLSEADVRTMQEIGGAAGDISDVEFARRWNRAALPQRLVSQAKWAVKRGEGIPWQEIGRRADRWGVKGVTENLIRAAEPFFVEAGVVAQSETAVQRGVKYARKNWKMMLGAGAVAAGLFIFEPLSVLNSDPQAERLRSGVSIADLSRPDQSTAEFVSGASADAFNTISGMSEQGMTSGIRQGMTPFGSGFLKRLWQGFRGRKPEGPAFIRKVFGSVEQFRKMGPSDVMGSIEKYRVKHAAQFWGSEARDVAAGGVSIKKHYVGEGVGYTAEAQVHFDPARFKAYGEEVMGAAPTTKLQEVMYGHEVAEVYYTRRSLKEIVKKDKDILTGSSSTGEKVFYSKTGGDPRLLEKLQGVEKVSTHMDKGVLEAEMFLAAKQGPEVFQEAIQFRGAEALFSGDAKYLKTVRGLQAKFKKQYLPMFQKDALDRAGPSAKAMKEASTDFGGMYRGMVKSLKSAVGSMRRGGVTRATKMPLMPRGVARNMVEVGGQKVQVIKRLGAGAEGTADLVRMSDKRMAVLKRSTGDLSNRYAYNPIVSAPGEASYEALKGVATRGERSLAREADIMISARKHYGDIVPEVYGSSESHILMEYAGKDISKASQDTRLRAAEWAGGAYQKMFSGTGPVHLDPSLGNVAMKKVGGKEEFRLIDWGVSLKRSELGKVPEADGIATRVRDFMQRSEGGQKKYAQALYEQHQVMKGIPAVPQLDTVTKGATGAPKNMAQAMRQKKRAQRLLKQQRAEKRVQEAARSGGKGHTGFMSTQPAGPGAMDPFAN